MTETQDVLVEVTGSLGRIRLNRPKALNSLTLEMVRSVSAALIRFENDPAVGAVLVTGEGERGLCAGGDIQALYEHGRDGTGFGETFFREEYRMNAHIAKYKKPYIAVMDGITMGGGVGISAHGAVRIVTERTKIAMPETGIGFFPDVGGTWLLSRRPDEVGTFIALTGDSFGGADAIFAGFADVLVQSQQIPALLETLAALPVSATVADIRQAVTNFAEDAKAPLAAHREEIDQAFAFDSVEEIFAALEKSATEFSKKSLQVLGRKSPTSMKVTLRLLRLARTDSSLEESLEREFAATHATLASDEFYEGVRAAVVDKDRNPKWSPASLADVTSAMVDKYFTPAVEKIF
jgi:enoyl-CoA hydratase